MDFIGRVPRLVEGIDRFFRDPVHTMRFYYIMDLYDLVFCACHYGRMRPRDMCRLLHCRTARATHLKNRTSIKKTTITQRAPTWGALCVMELLAGLEPATY